jgi:hypothetical protein
VGARCQLRKLRALRLVTVMCPMMLWCKQHD